MRPKKYLQIVCIGFFISLTGCSGGEEARIAMMKNMVDQVEHSIQVYDEKAAVAEEAISDIREILEDPNLAVPAREEMQAAIEKAVAVKAKFEVAKGVALEQVRAIKAKIAEIEADGIQSGEDLIVFGEGAKQIGYSLPAPVGPIFILIGTVIGALGEARKRKSDKIARGVVASVDKVIADANNPADVHAIKVRLKSVQRDLGVREGVKKLLDT